MESEVGDAQPHPARAFKRVGVSLLIFTLVLLHLYLLLPEGDNSVFNSTQRQALQDDGAVRGKKTGSPPWIIKGVRKRLPLCLGHYVLGSGSSVCPTLRQHPPVQDGWCLIKYYLTDNSLKTM